MTTVKVVDLRCVGQVMWRLFIIEHFLLYIYIYTYIYVYVWFVASFVVENHCPGSFWAWLIKILWDFKSNWFHVDHLLVLLSSIEVYSMIDSSKRIGKFPEVLNFNRFFLKLNRFFPDIVENRQTLKRHILQWHLIILRFWFSIGRDGVVICWEWASLVWP